MRLFPLLVGIVAIPFSVGWADDAKILIEAENPVDLRLPFIKVTTQSGQASGGAYLLIPWDGNRAKSAGQVAYKFDVKKPGLYVLWARTFWTPDQGNSVKVSVNKGFNIILGEDGTYKQWHWVGGKARVTLKKGENTLVLKYSEAGVRVDQFLLSQEEPEAQSAK